MTLFCSYLLSLAVYLCQIIRLALLFKTLSDLLFILLPLTSSFLFHLFSILFFFFFSLPSSFWIFSFLSSFSFFSFSELYSPFHTSIIFYSFFYPLLSFHTFITPSSLLQPPLSFFNTSLSPFSIPLYYPLPFSYIPTLLSFSLLLFPLSFLLFFSFLSFPSPYPSYSPFLSSPSLPSFINIAPSPLRSFIRDFAKAPEQKFSSFSLWLDYVHIRHFARMTKITSREEGPERVRRLAGRAGSQRKFVC